jgi:predicted acyltransferase (DUF342 family)/photosystem II stability/assembly factor-like uncharacterized protein
VGDLDICGGLRAKDNALMLSDLTVEGDIYGFGNINIDGAMNVFNTNIIGNIFIAENAFVRETLYMDLSGGTLLRGENNRFGFNTLTPQATMDISGDLVRTIDIHTTTATNKNVVARNVFNQGMTVNVEPNRAYIDFYVDTSMNLATEKFDGRLVYEQGGNFTIDVSNIVKFKPRVIFSQDLSKNLVADERIIIYGNPLADVPYIPTIYGDNTFKTGTAAYLVAGDNSSNAFFRLGTEKGTGMTLGGGYFPNNKIMGVVALIDNSNVKYPAMNIVSGNLINNLKTSIAVNKYNVSTVNEENKYAMDINGPIKLAHQELIVAADISFQVYRTAFFGNTGYAVGSPVTNNNPFTQFFLKTVDGGYTWTQTRIVDSGGNPNPNNLELTAHFFSAIYTIGATDILIAGDNRFFFRSTNGGQSWSKIPFKNGSNESNDIINTTSIFLSNQGLANERIIVGTGINSGISNGVILNSPTGEWNVNGIPTTYISTGLSAVNSIHGSGLDTVIVGAGGIVPYRTYLGGFGTRVATASTFYDVKVFNDGLKNHAVAVGANAIWYAHDLSWNGSAYAVSWSQVAVSGTLRSVQMLDASRAIAVGDAGLILYSVDGFATWFNPGTIDNNSLISGVNLSAISAVNANDFVVSGVIQNYGTSGRTKVFNLYAPYFLNRPNNHVLEASGNMVLSGDLQINDAGQILTTNNTNFNILPTVAQEINIGNTAVGGNTNVKANLDVTLNITGHQNMLLYGDASFNSRFFLGGDASLNSKLYVVGDASLNSRLFVGGDASLNSNLYVVKDSSLNGRLFVGGDASLNSKLYVVGDASLNSKLFVGDDASLNSKLYVVGDSSLNSKLFVGGDASLNSKLYVVGDASLNSKLFVGGDASLNSKLYVVGDSSLNSKLFVGGDASLNSNLYVVGDSSLNSKLFVGGDVSLNSNLYVVGDASLNSKLFVGGDVSLNSKLYVVGDSSLNSRLFVGGDVSLNSNLYVVGDSSLNSKLFVGGDVSLNSNLYVVKDSSLNSRLFVGGDVSLNSKLYVVGDTSLNSRLFVGGDVSLNSNLYVVKDASLNSRLFVGGDVSLNSKLYVVGDASLNTKLFVGGDVSLNSKLYVVGDSSLNSKLFVGGDVSLNSKLYVVGDSSLNSKMFVGGDVSLNSKLYVVGDASLNSKMFVGGDVSLNSNLYVVKDLSLNGRVFVGGDASLNSKLFVLGDSSLNSKLFVGGDVSLNSKLYVVGDASLNSRVFVGGDVSLNSKLYVVGDASLNSRVFVGGDVSLNSNLYVAGKTIISDLSAQNADFTGIVRANTFDSRPGSSLTIGGTNAGNITIKTSTGSTNTLTLGDAGSNTVILGNLTLPGSVTSTNINNLEIKNKTILLNDEAVGLNSAKFCGIQIRDDDVDNKGYFLTNGRSDGYLFKSGQSANRVNLDVSGLYLSNGLTQGFVVLRPTSSVVDISSDYTITTGLVNIADIQLLDTSLNRRVERDVGNTTVNTQTVSTKLLTGGLYVGKAVDTFIANSQMDILGNAFISKLGLGTSTVNANYTLEVNNNARIVNNLDVSGSLSVQTNINNSGIIIQW